MVNNTCIYKTQDLHNGLFINKILKYKNLQTKLQGHNNMSSNKSTRKVNINT